MQLLKKSNLLTKEELFTNKQLFQLKEKSQVYKRDKKLVKELKLEAQKRLAARGICEYPHQGLSELAIVRRNKARAKDLTKEVRLRSVKDRARLRDSIAFHTLLRKKKNDFIQFKKAQINEIQYNLNLLRYEFVRSRKDYLEAKNSRDSLWQVFLSTFLLFFGLKKGILRVRVQEFKVEKLANRKLNLFRALQNEGRNDYGGDRMIKKLVQAKIGISLYMRHLPIPDIKLRARRLIVTKIFKPVVWAHRTSQHLSRFYKIGIFQFSSIFNIFSDVVQKADEKPPSVANRNA